MKTPEEKREQIKEQIRALLGLLEDLDRNLMIIRLYQEQKEFNDLKTSGLRKDWAVLTKTNV